MSLTCTAIDDLLAAHVLGALKPEERAGVEEHLADCRRHDEELAAYRSAVARLPVAAEERAPPARLRTRLLTAFEEEAKAKGPLPRSRTPFFRFPRGALARPAFAYGLAAALALVAIGLAAWSVVLQAGGGDEATVSELTQDGMRLRVVYLPEEKLAILDIDMPEAPAGRTYQAWGIFEGGPVSLGLLANRGVAVFPADLEGAVAVAISVEPAGGSLQPTTDAVIIAEL